MSAIGRAAVLLTLAMSLMACTTVESPPINEERIREFLPNRQRKILKHPDKFEFLTLYPFHSIAPGDEHYHIGDRFHHYGILGRAEVTDRSQQAKLIEDLFVAVSEGSGYGNNCFEPRHAIHVEKDGEQLDIILCMACENVYAYHGEKKYSSGLAPQFLAEWSTTPQKLGLVVHGERRKR